VEENRNDLHTFALDFLQELFCEVKTGGRGCNSPQHAGVDGLVRFLVLLGRVPFDIVGQRRNPDPFDDLEEIPFVG